MRDNQSAHGNRLHALRKRQGKSFAPACQNKIKQSPPVKRKQTIIPAPETDLSVKKVPTLDEFVEEKYAPKEEEAALPKQEEEKKEAPADFSGPSNAHYAPYPPQYPYPYPPYPYPYPASPQAPAYLMGEDGKPYQMPPIVQPVAFVPYVTQEQPLMQYSPAVDQKPQRAVPSAPAKDGRKN